MTKTDLPLNLDRRHLLASAVAVPAASIVPGVRCAEPVNLAAAGGIRSAFFDVFTRRYPQRP